jgi:hypothetical protein
VRRETVLTQQVTCVCILNVCKRVRMRGCVCLPLSHTHTHTLSLSLTHSLILSLSVSLFAQYVCVGCLKWDTPDCWFVPGKRLPLAYLCGLQPW